MVEVGGALRWMSRWGWARFCPIVLFSPTGWYQKWYKTTEIESERISFKGLDASTNTTDLYIPFVDILKVTPDSSSVLLK